jgi:hypothetical protein
LELKYVSRKRNDHRFSLNGCEQEFVAAPILRDLSERHEFGPGRDQSLCFE